MKKFLNFVIRISILNFIFILVAVVFISKYKEGGLENPDLSKKTQQTANIKKSNIINVSENQNISNQLEPTQKTQNLFSELSMHSTRNNCWIVYSGHIYDITLFFGSHPGGDSIMLKYCGQDATFGFDTKEKSSPMPHSENAVSLLSQYLIQ